MKLTYLDCWYFLLPSAFFQQNVQLHCIYPLYALHSSIHHGHNDMLKQSFQEILQQPISKKMVNYQQSFLQKNYKLKVRERRKEINTETDNPHWLCILLHNFDRIGNVFIADFWSTFVYLVGHKFISKTLSTRSKNLSFFPYSNLQHSEKWHTTPFNQKIFWVNS